MRISNRNLAEILLFLLRLLAFSALIYIGIYFIDLTLLQKTIAMQVGNLLELFGIDSVVKGAVLHFDGFSILVSKDSTGWKSLLFLAVLILSTKSSDSSKIWGIMLLLPAIYILNLLRVSITSYSTFYGVNVFYFFHDVLWQLGMVIGVIALWLFWLRFLREARV